MKKKKTKLKSEEIINTMFFELSFKLVKFVNKVLYV